jgi:hypothetical protein
MGLTAVLVTAKSRLADRAQLRHDVDAAAAMAITIVAVVDVADARTAHQLVASGEVDCIAFTRDLPTVRRLSLPGRTVPLPRDGESPTQRRPQLVGQRTQPLDRTQPESNVADVAFSPPEPEPVRRRASDRSRRRRRRT